MPATGLGIFLLATNEQRDEGLHLQVQYVQHVKT